MAHPADCGPVQPSLAQNPDQPTPIYAVASPEETTDTQKFIHAIFCGVIKAF